MNEWLLVGIGLVLTVGTGLFVASEFALVNLDRHDLEQRREGGEKGLGATITALRITSTHLSSAQLGITLTTLLTGYTFEPAVSSLLEEPLTSLGIPAGAVTALGAVIGVLLATLFSMVIGELVPKNFALALPLATAKVVVPFQTLFTKVFKPIVLLLNNTANGLIRFLGIEPKEELSGARTADELIYLSSVHATDTAAQVIAVSLPERESTTASARRHRSSRRRDPRRNGSVGEGPTTRHADTLCPGRWSALDSRLAMQNREVGAIPTRSSPL